MAQPTATPAPVEWVSIASLFPDAVASLPALFMGTDQIIERMVAMEHTLENCDMLLIYSADAGREVASHAREAASVNPEIPRIRGVSRREMRHLSPRALRFVHMDRANARAMAALSANERASDYIERACDELEHLQSTAKNMKTALADEIKTFACTIYAAAKKRTDEQARRASDREAVYTYGALLCSNKRLRDMYKAWFPNTRPFTRDDDIKSKAFVREAEETQEHLLTCKDDKCIAAPCWLRKHRITCPASLSSVCVSRVCHFHRMLAYYHAKYCTKPDGTCPLSNCVLYRSVAQFFRDLAHNE